MNTAPCPVCGSFLQQREMLYEFYTKPREDGKQQFCVTWARDSPRDATYPSGKRCSVHVAQFFFADPKPYIERDQAEGWTVFQSTKP